MTSLEDLKSSINDERLSSPRKIDKVVKCAVLTKSPLRNIQRGKMFSMTLCDQDTSSTIRAVSFDEGVYDKFEATKTYDLKSFKVKKGFGANSGMEILISEEAEVNDSLVQFRIEKTTFKISQILRRETVNVRFFTVKAKVISIEDAMMVGKHPNEKLKRDVLLGDETGLVTLVLWRQKAKSIDFKEGDVLAIENTVCSTFNKNVVLTTAEETIITVTNEMMNFELPANSSTSGLKRNAKVTCIETTILAMKEFRCDYRCINCRRDIDWVSSSEGSTASEGEVVKCPFCSTVFMGSVAKVKNECKLMLSANDEWFTVRTGVLQHMLDWVAAKKKPSDQDISILLKSKFSMRLDLERKVIEHAAICVPCEEKHQDEPAILEAKKPKESDPSDDKLRKLLDMAIDKCMDD